MYHCPNCNLDFENETGVCYNCGTICYTDVAIPSVPEKKHSPDHTGEFAYADIHENKLIAFLAYSTGIFGVLLALLVRRDSPYLKFHVKEALKLIVGSVIAPVAFVVPAAIALVAAVFGALVNFLGVLLGIVAGVAYAAVLVLMVAIIIARIISAIRVLMNKSVEAPIVRKIDFLN